MKFLEFCFENVNIKLKQKRTCSGVFKLICFEFSAIYKQRYEKPCNQTTYWIPFAGIYQINLSDKYVE